MFKSFKFWSISVLLLMSVLFLTACKSKNLQEQEQVLGLRDENGCRFEVARVEELDFEFCVDGYEVEVVSTEDEFAEIRFGDKLVGYYLNGVLSNEFYDIEGLDYTLRYLEFSESNLPVKDKNLVGLNLFNIGRYTILQIQYKSEENYVFGLDRTFWIMLSDKIFRFDSLENIQEFLQVREA